MRVSTTGAATATRVGPRHRWRGGGGVGSPETGAGRGVTGEGAAARGEKREERGERSEREERELRGGRYPNSGRA